MTVTRATLAERVLQNLGLPKNEADRLVVFVFDLIKHELQHGQPVKLSGFGRFVVRGKRARRGRNPQTGEAITIEQRRVLIFKASRALKDSMGQTRPEG